MNHLPAFKQFLLVKNYSANSIRNYLADISRFLTYPSLPTFLSAIKDDANQKRYLSSLKLYFQFALDQGLISNNPLKKNLESLNINQIVSNYQTYLEKHHKSKATIKNYIADIRQYFEFVLNKNY